MERLITPFESWTEGSEPTCLCPKPSYLHLLCWPSPCCHHQQRDCRAPVIARRAHIPYLVCYYLASIGGQGEHLSPSGLLSLMWSSEVNIIKQWGSTQTKLAWDSGMGFFCSMFKQRAILCLRWVDTEFLKRNRTEPWSLIPRVENTVFSFHLSAKTSKQIPPLYLKRPVCSLCLLVTINSDI